MHALDAADHAGGWSVDASVAIAEWDRHGLERLVRYCARPPLSQERLGRLDDDHLVYRLRNEHVTLQREAERRASEFTLTATEIVTPGGGSAW